MSSVSKMPRIHLADRNTQVDLSGSTLVYPEPLSQTHAAQVYDLQRLVEWAMHRGYGTDSVSLTITWTREDMQEALGRQINGEFLALAQDWLDGTSGGFAAASVYHAWEDVLTEMRAMFDLDGGPKCDGDE